MIAYIYYPHLASVRFEHSVCRGSYIYIYIYKYIYVFIYIISKYGTPTEKVSEFLDHHLQTVMKGSRSYVQDTQDFLENFKHLGKVPSNAILVTAAVEGLYLSTSHETGLEVLYEMLEKGCKRKFHLQIYLIWLNWY